MATTLTPTPDALDPRTRQRRRIVIVLLLALVAFNGLGAFPLHEPDEGRYASIAAEMQRGGDWVTPHLSGIEYFEKPPLHFWLVGASFAVFGRGELAARLPTATAFLLAGLLVMAWASRGFGRRAELAALVFATLPLAGFFSHLVMVDTTLMLLVACCLYAAWRGVVEPPPDQPADRKWVWLAWLAAGVAMLVKGPIGVVLPFASAVVFLGITRDWRRLWALLRPDGPLLFALVCAPWFVAMSLAHPGYARVFFLEQNLARATTGGHFDRQGSIVFYIPILLGTFFPWSLLIPLMARSVKAGGLRPTDPTQRLRLYLACAVAIPFAILSLAGSQLVYYLLPLAPPFALLATDALLNLPAPTPAVRPGGGGALLVLGGILVAAAVLVLPGMFLPHETLERIAALKGEELAFQRQSLQRLRGVQLAIPFAAGGVFLAGLMFWKAGSRLKRGLGRAACAALGYAALVVLLAAPWVMGRAAAVFSARGLATELGGREGQAPIFVYGTFLRCLPFYLDRPNYLWVATYAEFGHEVKRGDSPYALQEDEAALAKLFTDPRVIVIAKSDDAAKAVQELVPVKLRRVSTFGRRVVLVQERRKPE